MVNTGSATDRKLNWFAALYADRRPIDVSAHWCYITNTKQARDMHVWCPLTDLFPFKSCNGLITKNKSFVKLDGFIITGLWVDRENCHVTEWTFEVSFP